MRLWERGMLYCIPVPGQNSWAESSNAVMYTSMESGTQQREKRPRVDAEATDNMDYDVEYDFKFYKLDMPADIQMLVLSEGKSNILPADVVLPLHPSSVASDEVTAEALEAWRWYLATLRSLPHSINSEIQKVIDNDLVAARQEDRTLGSQDFSRLLTMGRLMSMSFGETSLSLEHWQIVKELARLQRERLK